MQPLTCTRAMRSALPVRARRAVAAASVVHAARVEALGCRAINQGAATHQPWKGRRAKKYTDMSAAIETHSLLHLYAVCLNELQRKLVLRR
eukprot:2375156-Pleurochrysis_carterae.AAC.1